MPAHGRSTSHPFTVAACAACPPDIAARLLPQLRATVRDCPHGVLILTECLLGKLLCTNRTHGIMLFLQPCTEDRRPTGSAHWIGPVRTEAEAQDVSAWIAAGHWNSAPLPPALLADANLARAARLN